MSERMGTVSAESSVESVARAAEMQVPEPDGMQVEMERMAMVDAAEESIRAVAMP